MKKKRIFIISLLLVFLLAIATLPSACSQPEEKNQFLELMKLVPVDVSDWTNIKFVNYQKLQEANGISLLDREDFVPTMLSLLGEDRHALDILGLSSFHTGWSPSSPNFTIQREYLGYDLTDVNAEINCYLQPTFTRPICSITAALGRFSETATNEALQTQDEWPDWVLENYESESYHSVTLHTWGDGDQTHAKDHYSLPHLDSSGRAMPLAVSGNALLVSSSENITKRMIDASLDRIQTLADLQEFSSLAQALCDLDLFGAIVFDERGRIPEKIDAPPETSPPLKPYLILASGLGHDENGYFCVLVLVHENPEYAQENVILLRERLQMEYKPLVYGKSDTFHLSEWISDTLIQADGNVLTARLDSEKADLWIDLLYEFPELIRWEE